MAAPKKPRQPKLQFVEEDGQIGVYSDIFTVEMDASGMVAVTFYQTGSNFNATQIGRPQQIQDREVRFVSKVHLSPQGFVALSKAFEDNANAVKQALTNAVQQQIVLDLSRSPVLQGK